MNLCVQRQPTLVGCTHGTLSIDGILECPTLEPPIREVPGQPVESWKIQDHTAIPAGRYQVTIDYSPHFGEPMPHVLAVPGFTGVRIHPGNTVVDTEGCLLVGRQSAATGITQSRAEFDQLFPKIQAALVDGGEVWITYLNPEVSA